MATTKTGIEVADRPNRFYEAIIILNPDVKEEEQKTFFQKNVETIKKYSGELNHLDTWGRRKLANPIKKSRTGTYFHSSFEANSECVAELERMMKIDDRVLRYMHTRLDERIPLSKHIDRFKESLTEAAKREQEREAKRDMRRRDASGRGDRGPRRRDFDKPAGDKFGGDKMASEKPATENSGSEE